MPKDGGAAFPRGAWPIECAGEQDGMTLRDYFAAHALQFGGIAMTTRVMLGEQFDPVQNVEGIVNVAYVIADAMLAAREKR